ncbi:MAG: TPM domain-containing protein [bacterium]
MAYHEDYPAHYDEFINDFAEIITSKDEEAIKAVTQTLRSQRGIPIVVVTIGTIHDYTSGHNTIEGFATGLFNNWGIGSREKNMGILLLVAKEDRKLRIELGAGYGRRLDRECKAIVDKVIVPQFKKGDLSGGIVLGVKAIDQMLRGKPPVPLTQKQQITHFIIDVVLLITVISLV